MSLLGARVRRADRAAILLEPAPYSPIEEVLERTPRFGFEEAELRVVLDVLHLWMKVRLGVGFGPISRDFREAAVTERMAANDVFLEQGLLFLHSVELSAEFLIVKANTWFDPSRGRPSYACYEGPGDGSYRSIHVGETLKEVLFDVWAFQQRNSPLRKPVAVSRKA